MPALWTAIVLAGGRSTRLGQDKVQATVDERRLIDHVLAALPADVDVVVVGPDPEGTARPYVLTREAQPGAGPVAAIAAGLAGATTPLVAILAADMPFAGTLLPDLIRQLDHAADDIDAVIPVDQDGREQPLAAAYRADALARALATLGAPEGRSVRDLRAGLTALLRPIEAASTLLDVDTADDLAEARRSVPLSEDVDLATGNQDEKGGSMDEWVAAVSAALGVDQAIDLDTILDVARDAAHAVARPAAPVTTFLLGCAVAAGADPAEAAAKIAALAQGWPTEQ